MMMQMLIDSSGSLSDSTELTRERDWRGNLKSSLDSQMHLWAHDVAPFGDALGLNTKSILLADAFGKAAVGDFESAMTMGFVMVFSSMFGLA